MTSSISELPDDLLIKVLSFLSTKHAGTTSLLSKRWRSLWSLVPRLKFDVSDHNHTIDNSLILHEFHVIESLYFKLDASLWQKNIGHRIKTAVNHHHCHLRVMEVDACNAYIQLPCELFTCKKLVVLKLKGLLIDVKPLTSISLPSLKTLHLDISLFMRRSLQMLLSNCSLVTDLVIMRRSRFSASKFDISWCKSLVLLKLEGLIDVSISSSAAASGLPWLKTLHIARGKNLSKDCFCQFLSNCPLLSDLTVEKETIDAMLNLDFTIPALKRLSIITEVEISTHFISLLNSYIQKFAKVAPSFNHLNIQERNTSFSLSVRFMSPTNFEDASIFPRIVYLEMICSVSSEAMLADLLLCCNKLVVLKLKNVRNTLFLYQWKPPSFVPECLLSSLEAFEWKGYTGIKRDRELVSYLLNHALCLKTSKIFYDSYNEENEQQIIDYLASVPTGSRTCQIVLEQLVD